MKFGVHVFVQFMLSIPRLSLYFHRPSREIRHMFSLIRYILDVDPFVESVFSYRFREISGENVAYITDACSYLISAMRFLEFFFNCWIGVHQDC